MEYSTTTASKDGDMYFQHIHGPFYIKISHSTKRLWCTEVLALVMGHHLYPMMVCGEDLDGVRAIVETEVKLPNRVVFARQCGRG